MKKWLLIFVALSLILVVFAYAFIPSKLRISNLVNCRTTANGLGRLFARQQIWDNVSNKKVTVTKRYLNVADIMLQWRQIKIPVKVMALPLSSDSATIIWETAIQTSANPFTRIWDYNSARTIKAEMKAIIDSFCKFSANDENVYGISIVERSTTDTSLIATRFRTATYPSITDIYQNIERLKLFASHHNVRQTGFPMLNVRVNGPGSYSGMIALPVEKPIQTSASSTGDYSKLSQSPVFSLRMVPGKFLTTEVIGGPATIQHGHDMMNLYFEDYKRTSMAIPFEYLVTDRQLEKDTTLWITKIYAPVY